MKQPEIDLSISIVTYNSENMIYQCLQSIFSMEHPFRYEVLVVDNNSMDRTVLDVECKYPRVTLIRNNRNMGYARANNQAIAASRGRYVLILNPDIVVLKDALEKMFDYMESNPHVGVAGCRLVSPNGELQLSCRRFPSLMTFLLRGTRIGTLFPRIRLVEDYLLERENHQQDLDVDWCLGCSLMVRRKALDEVGMLDRKYFLYYEDIDLCYRMKQKNWKVSYIASAEMIHHYRRQSASLPPNLHTLIHCKSALYFFWKFRKQRKLRTFF